MTLPTDDARELIDRLSKLSIAATAPPVDDEQRQAWDALASALLTHRVELFDLAEEALLGRKARADTSLACCWEATIECVDDKLEVAIETVRFDEFEALDDLIPVEIGWGDVERIEIRLVNDERAGNLPDVLEQVRS